MEKLSQPQQEILKQVMSEGPSYMERGEKIIENISRLRVRDYVRVFERMKKLRDVGDLEVGDYWIAYAKLRELSMKEFDYPLEWMQLEQEIDITKQYDSQIQFLTTAGILTNLPKSQSLGITGVDGIEYPVPTLKEIGNYITPEKGELFLQKQTEGFTKLLLVPFGMLLTNLYKKYQEYFYDFVYVGKQLKNSSGRAQVEIHR